MNIRTLLFSVVAVAASATASPAQSASAQAETLFNQARTLMSQKKYSEACDAFASSQKLDASPTTMFSLAVCHELNGKFATAWGTLLDFDRAYGSSTKPADLELVKKARERAKALESRLSTLTISVPTTVRNDALSIERDGVAVDRGAWDRALPVDGGEHSVTVHRPGFKAWSTSITVKAEKDPASVTVPTLEAEPVPVAAAQPVELPPTPADAAPVHVEPVEHASHSKVVPISFAAGAVVLGGATLGFELWGRSLHDDAQRLLDDGNATSANDKQDKANNRRYIAQGMGVAAVACAGVSIYLFLRGDGDSSSQQAIRRVVPVATDQQVGLGLVGQW